MGHERKYMGHETANWGGRGLGYMLFNAYLCNQPYYWEVVVGPGAQLCTLLEVWVLRVGMSTLGRKRLCTSRIGDPQVPMTMDTLIVYKWLLKLIHSSPLTLTICDLLPPIHLPLLRYPLPDSNCARECKTIVRDRELSLGFTVFGKGK
jgi:hypothetical protein